MREYVQIFWREVNIMINTEKPNWFIYLRLTEAHRRKVAEFEFREASNAFVAAVDSIRPDLQDGTIHVVKPYDFKEEYGVETSVVVEPDAIMIERRETRFVRLLSYIDPRSHMTLNDSYNINVHTTGKVRLQNSTIGEIMYGHKTTSPPPGRFELSWDKSLTVPMPVELPEDKAVALDSLRAILESVKK